MEDIRNTSLTLGLQEIKMVKLTSFPLVERIRAFSSGSTSWTITQLKNLLILLKQTKMTKDLMRTKAKKKASVRMKKKTMVASEKYSLMKVIKEAALTFGVVKLSIVHLMASK